MYPSVQRLLPGFSTLLAGCGTSRALAVNGTEFSSEAEFKRWMADVLGSDQQRRLAGEHYQHNKVIAVFPGHGPNHFAFRFYQYDAASGALYADLECANVSTAAGLFAVLQGIAAPALDGCLTASNLGTGQLLALCPQQQERYWDSPWNVSFLYPEGLRIPAWSGDEPHWVTTASGVRVAIWVAQHGNLFILAEGAPESLNDGDLAELSRIGSEIALALGCPESLAENAKLLLFEPLASSAEQGRVRTTLYYKGQRHHSIAGSAAMFLAGCFASSLPEPERLALLQRPYCVTIEHPSGTLAVSVHAMLDSEGAFAIQATTFATPVRLFLVGQAVTAPVEVAA